MRVLLVDDDETFLDEVVPEFAKVIGKGTLDVARSRDDAIVALNGNFYDVLVLDLKIPTAEGALDEAVEHGQAVFHHARACAPGTPVYFLTGSSADDVVTDLLRHAEQADVWGSRTNIPTVHLLRKTRLTDLVDELRSVSEIVDATDEIEVSTQGLDLQLNQQQKRVLRVFTRRRGGNLCRVAALSGGLSNSRVFRLTVYDSNGVTQMIAAGKVARLELVEDEVQRFEQHVNRLKAGSFPPMIEVVRAGANKWAGVFYRLLDGFDHSLFSVLEAGCRGSGETVGRVRDLTLPWTAGVPSSPMQITDIRRRLLSDDITQKLSAVFELSWAADMEAKRIQVRHAGLHGDLHGGNILIGPNETPILIDFGDVGPGAAAIDPITLEFSLLFHPGFQAIRGTWPDRARATEWGTIDAYVQDCPYPEFVRACREWSHSVAAGDREVYACAYAYLVRQLKYPETDKTLILKLLGAVRGAFDATY